MWTAFKWWAGLDRSDSGTRRWPAHQGHHERHQREQGPDRRIRRGERPRPRARTGARGAHVRGTGLLRSGAVGLGLGDSALPGAITGKNRGKTGNEAKNWDLGQKTTNLNHGLALRVGGVQVKEPFGVDAPRGSAFLETPSAARGPLAPPLEIESTDHRYGITLPGDGRQSQWENRSRGFVVRDAPRTARILDGGGTALALTDASASRSNTTVDPDAWFGTLGHIGGARGVLGGGVLPAAECRVVASTQLPDHVARARGIEMKSHRKSRPRDT